MELPEEGHHWRPWSRTRLLLSVLDAVCQEQFVDCGSVPPWREWCRSLRAAGKPAVSNAIPAIFQPVLGRYGCIASGSNASVLWHDDGQPPDQPAGGATRGHGRDAGQPSFFHSRGQWRFCIGSAWLLQRLWCFWQRFRRRFRRRNQLWQWLWRFTGCRWRV